VPRTPTRKLQPDKAEGSRRAIEHELERQPKRPSPSDPKREQQGKKGKKPDPS